MRVGGVEVDLVERRIHRDGVSLSLTRLEARLLVYLADRPDIDVSRDELLASVWDYTPGATTRAVDFVVRRLRSKLGDAGRSHLLTAHGVGYRLVGGRAPPPPPVSTRAPLRLGTGRLDLDRRRFLPNAGEPTSLTSQEGALCDVLGASAGFVDRETVARAVWGRPASEALTALVGRLRQKLGDPEGTVIVSSRRLGLHLERIDGRTNLGPSTDSFVPRDELHRSRVALEGARCLTLIGPAGVGKSRLALELGRELLGADPVIEVWWVPLASAEGRRSLLQAVATAVGVRLDRTDPVGQIARGLDRRSAVVVLDNFEQLVAEAEIVGSWLAATTGVRFVLTSRCPLPLPGVDLEVRPLPLDAAIVLFRDRTREARPSVDDPELARPVEALVAQLDGLPLAIELASARAERFDVAWLAANAGRRLEWMVRPSGGSHGTLRGAIDTSWDLLGDEERTTLARLALFRGRIPPALAPDGPALGRLVDHALVRRSGDGWQLSETVRLYALERLAVSGDRERATEAHRRVLLDRAADAAEDVGWRGRHLGAIAFLRDVRDDLQTLAERSGPVDDRARAAIALGTLLANDGPVTGIIDTAEAIAAEGPSEAWRLEVRLALALGVAGQHDRAEFYAREAVAHAGTSAVARIHTNRLLAVTLRKAGRREDAEQRMREALDDARALDAPSTTAALLNNLGNLLKDTSRFDEAFAAYAEAERICTTCGYIALLAHVFSNRSELHSLVADAQGALRAAEAATALALELDSPYLVAVFATHRSSAGASLGDLEGSDEVLRISDESLVRMGCTEERLKILGDRGILAVERGDHSLARALFEEGLRIPVSALHRSRLLLQANHAISVLLAGEARRSVGMFQPLAAEMETGGGSHVLAFLHGFLAVALSRTSAPYRSALERARSSPAVGPAAVFLDLVEALVEGEPAAIDRAVRVCRQPENRTHQDVRLLVLLADR